MKRAVVISVLGLVLAVLGYCAVYFKCTSQHRQMVEQPAPELAWLKKEFHLGDAEFERIARLHEGYLPRCAELCRRIAEKNAELKQLTAGTNVEAKAVEQNIQEAGALRVECQKNMFNHFLEVSRQMPPEQGRRYLKWVQERTLLPEHDMAQQHGGHQMEHH